MPLNLVSSSYIMLEGGKEMGVIVEDHILIRISTVKSREIYVSNSLKSNNTKFISIIRLHFNYIPNLLNLNMVKLQFWCHRIL